MDQIALRSSLAYPNLQDQRLENVEQWASQVTGLTHGQCVAISWIAVGFAVIAILVMTVGQWVAVFKVRWWAKQLMMESERLPEKARVDVACRQNRHFRFALATSAV